MPAKRAFTEKGQTLVSTNRLATTFDVRNARRCAHCIVIFADCTLSCCLVVTEY